MDIKELKKEKTNQDDNEIILNKYRHHPLIKDLNLTDKELKEYLGVIAHIIKKKESYETSNHNNAFFYTQLIRNIHGKLEVISVPNEKTYEWLNIRNHYLIRNFPDSHLKILMNHESIGKISVSKKNVLDEYRKILNNPNKARGIYVYGKVGVGKTYTSIALANEFAKRNFNVAFVNCAEIGYKLKLGFDLPNSVNDEIVDKMKESDVLFLDDIGAEDEKIWFYNNYLLITLNYRMDRNKLTFFTSNLNIESFYKKLSNLMHKSFNAERLIERIKALTHNQEIEITGSNQRY